MNFSIKWYDRVGSTNQVLKDAFLDNDNIVDHFIIATYEQTAGRGRSD